MLSIRYSLFAIRHFAFLLVLMTAGCQTLTPKQTKNRAETKWDSVRARVKLQLAQQHIERGLFDDALAAASESLAFDPTEPGAYVVAAEAHLEKDELASAEHTIDTALKAGAESPDLDYLHAVVLEQRGEIEQAADSYRRAREQGKTQSAALLAEAECHVAAGNPSAALDLLEDNYRKYDDQAPIAVLAARIAERLGDSDRAIRWYREARTAVPDDPIILAPLGRLLGENSQCTEAITILQPLVKSSSNSTSDQASMRRTLATCYMTAGDPKNAQSVLFDYARRTPTDGVAVLLLAQSSLAINDLMTAAWAINQLEDRGIEPRQVTLLRAILQSRQGKLSDAAATLERLVELHPDDADACCFLGVVLQDLGDPDAATNAFERALYADPGNPLATQQLARLERS